MTAHNTAPAFENTLDFARAMDAKDPLGSFRSEFLFPPSPKGGAATYLCGNSLGLQPKNVRKYIEDELDDWARWGVEGHLEARHPWLPYHEFLTASVARIVGGLPHEVVVMNTLTVNLHLMMVSFYRPTQQRFRILCEATAFPSDQYAVASQARFHGFDPREAILELKPREGESTLRPEDILETIEREGDSIALVMLGNVNYLTGQYFDIPTITKAAHDKGCVVGWDLAHGAGNLLLKLHDWNVDFAVWCSYKYLNGGPGTLAGAFVHERHAHDNTLPRFAGWWGHDKTRRFEMRPEFQAIPGAEGWQLSNPPIFQLAALRASFELFDRATMPALRAKGDLLSSYLLWRLDELNSPDVTVTTPRDVKQRGNQLSLRVKNGKALVESLSAAGVICDFREPDIIRVAPAPLYNRFQDVHAFIEVMKSHVQHARS